MHDPLVVAFQVRRPWPRREKYGATKPGQPRWCIRYRHDTCHDDCTHGDRSVFPWWRPSSYRAFWTLAGQGWYWPPIVTIWHVEPGGHDSGEVCKHWRRVRNLDGTWGSSYSHGWKWHVHHWRIQMHPAQALRRWALTRCEWCRGRSIKGDQVNVSHQWDRESGPWWRGERGLYHHDCSSIASAHETCLCEDPRLDKRLGGYAYGYCAKCRKFRPWKMGSSQLQRERMLAAIPAGGRDAGVYALVCALARADPPTYTDTEG